MQTPEDRLVTVFSELVERSNADHGQLNFSRGERAVWFITIVRQDIESSFRSIFEQSMSKSELIEAAGYLSDVGLSIIGDCFQEIVRVLDYHGFYGGGDIPAIAFKEVPNYVWEWIDEIGDDLQKTGVLWYVDGKLCEMLDEG